MSPQEAVDEARAEPSQGAARAEKTPRAFWFGLAVGWILIGIGVRYAIVEVGSGFSGFLVFVGGYAVLHDALVLPVAAALSVMINRLAPPLAQTPVRLGVAASWLMFLVSLPGVLAFGARADNPTILPVNVGRNLAIIVAATWALVVVASAVRMRSATTEGQSE